MNSMTDSCKSKVAIVKCEDYQEEKVYEAVRDSVDLLGGIGGFIRDGDRVLLKHRL